MSIDKSKELYDKILSELELFSDELSFDAMATKPAIINQYNLLSNIPVNLSVSSGNHVVLGHRIPMSYIDINSVSDCDSDCNILSFSGINASGDITYATDNIISIKIEKDISSFAAGSTISGSDEISFTSTGVTPGSCSGFSDYSISDQISVDNALISFVTGIGSEIPFSGGSGNVESSYFERLGSGTFIIAPPLSSQDDYFYIYTTGTSSYRGVAHPSETGIKQVVGGSSEWSALSNNFILCLYNSDPSSIFKYNVEQDNWTAINPFNTGINTELTNIIKLENDAGYYLVLGTGTGEYVLYNSIFDFATGILDSTDEGYKILPANIALIPSYVTTGCQWQVDSSQDMRLGDSEYHIFLTDYDYSGNLTYPLKLKNINFSPIIENGDFVLSGNIVSGTTYLSNYLNYRTDIINVADKLVISLSSTGTNNSQLVIWDNSTLTTDSIYSSEKKNRLVRLVNDQILWCSSSNSGISTVIDPYEIKEYPFPVPLTGNISVATSCPLEFRTLMLDAAGTNAYIVNDLDRTYETLSFTGSLSMGRYHDIIVLDQLPNSSDHSHNFYLMPDETYSNDFPKANLITISTTTTSFTGITIDGDFTIDETTTTGLIEIGRFFVPSGADDEFVGTYTFGMDDALGNSSIFDLTFNNGSGIIYVKSGIYLDYEDQNFYYGYITGVDLYVDRGNSNNNFTLRLLPVNEAPTGIVFDPPNSGGYNINIPVDEDKLVATFDVKDPDTVFTGIFDRLKQFNNVIGVSGVDADIFNVNFNDILQEGSIFVKNGTAFDIDSKDLYELTLYAGQSGSGFSTSGNWTLYLTDNPPISIDITPSQTGLPENFIPPQTGFKLSDFIVQDNDTNRNNFVSLIGNDASYFSIDYDFASGTGSLVLEPDVVLDYETKPTVTATLVAGNLPGIYSATRTFTINVQDVEFEISGITATPDIFYLYEDVDTSTGSIKLCDLKWTDPDLDLNPGADMVVFDLRYTGTNFGSALDKFTVVDNSTKYPKIYLKQGAVLDYEVATRYDIFVYARPDFNQDSYGTQITLVVRDINDPPNVTFDPTGILLAETTPSNAGSFKVCDIVVADEELSSVNFALTGQDSSYFTMQIKEGIPNSLSGENVGSIYFNSGINLNIDSKNSYTATVLATDSSGLVGTGNFTIEITDDPFCEYRINLVSLVNNNCANQENGRIVLDILYTGEDNNSCTINSPLSVSWINLPSGVSSSFGGRNLNNLPTGNYSGFIYGGEIPLEEISYTISSTSDLEFLQATKIYNSCETTGILQVVWQGGVPPYYVSYGTARAVVSSGFKANLNVINNTVNISPTVLDSLGCEVSSEEDISFEFPGVSFVEYQSQSPPIIYDDTIESFKLNVSNGDGPNQVEIYHTTTGERDSLFASFDMFDTTILESIDKSNNIYYYNFKNTLYPGYYIFDFINSDGCSVSSSLLLAQNITPMSLNVDIQHDAPSDNGSFTISQPILETLFVPYKMILNNSNVLSYINGITEKTDIKFEINGKIYKRKSLNGVVNCDDYSILNIKFLGIKDTDWYYTISFFQGFDLTDAELNILSSDIYLVLPNEEKIKIVTELNNNINTIKLLKGSIITGTSRIAQYSYNRELGLYYFEQNYIPLEAKSFVFDTLTLTNKYIPGTVTRISFLEHPDISDNLRSDLLESISFSGTDTQSRILNNRKFLLALNNFGKSTIMYSKTENYYTHDGSIVNSITGGYGEYNINYYYYNKETKCLNLLKYNNETLTEAEAQPIPHGSYVVKIRDIYGNKIKSVNNIAYDTVYTNYLDYILNTLDTTTENMNFEYGDILVNIVDTTRQDIPDDGGLPGSEPETPTPVPPATPSNRVTETTYRVSPNTDYKNSVTIQTSPIKVSFIVTGPYGYSKKFHDTSILTQLPPGVYYIEGDKTDLRNKYLYQDKKSFAINKNTNIFVQLRFNSYRDTIQIEDTCEL